MLAGVVSVLFRQPLIIGFIAAGIGLGPAGLNIIRSTEEITALAEMGLALLLFVVGLKLDLGLIRSMGTVALATGIGQVLFTTVGGFVLALVLGMSPMTALYVAIALTFSSTIIVVKLLSDKRETESLHGRIALGFLIVQDIVVVLMMIALSSLTGANGVHPLVQVMQIVLKAAIFIAAVSLISVKVFPRILPSIARSAELLVLFGITWALVLAELGDMMGFSKEVGAFMAGISLASTAFRDIIGAKLVSLRDFLLLFFFIELGSRLNLTNLTSQVAAAIPLSVFVLIGNPIIVMIIMGYLGYRKRTSFMAGLTVAQISEFSLILIAMGANAGHVGADAVGVVTLVGLITIGLSTYMIIYAQPLYERLSPWLGVFERKTPHHEDINTSAIRHFRDQVVILVGLGQYGTGIARHLVTRGRQVLGVDFNPQAVKAWNAAGGVAVFGDVEDPDFAHSLPLSQSRWVVSSIRDSRINTGIVHALRHTGYTGHIALSAYSRKEVPPALCQEADLLFAPYEDASEQAVDLLCDAEARIERRAMDKLIESMSGHYIVCGFGRMGQQIVKDFTRQQVPHVVVEDNPEQLPKLRDRQIPHVEGNASDDATLIKAGIERAKGLIAVASSDEVNVFIVLTARVLNANLFIVARSIREENEDKLRRAGADRVMSPYILGGRRMAASVTRPGIMDFLDLVLHSEKLEAEFHMLPVTEDCPLVHRTISQIGFRSQAGVTLLAISRPGQDVIVNPSADFEVLPGDELIVMGTPAQIERLCKL